MGNFLVITVAIKVQLLFFAAAIISPSPASASYLTQGMRVLTKTSVQVRASASAQASLAGTQPARALGRIISGPVHAGAVSWWQVNYDQGSDGWTDGAGLLEAYFPPSESSGGWRSLVPRNGTPSSSQIAAVRQMAGLDWNKLKLANDYSKSLSSGSAVIVIRNGWIAGEWGSTNSVNVASVTKSLTGLALAKLFEMSSAGQLSQSITPESLVHSYLPAKFAGSDTRKQQIRMKHFMTMSSGIQSADSSAFNLTLDQALTYPMSAAPGREWSYVSLPLQLSSVIVRNVGGQSLQSFFATHISNPIGAALTSWQTWAGYTSAASGAYINPRNLARIGYVMLHQGQWGSGTGMKRVLRSESLAQLSNWDSSLQSATAFKSVTPFFAPDPESEKYYGRLFWTNRTRAALGSAVPADAYYMHGFKDNLCIVIPSLDMVIVRLATSGPGMHPAFRREFMSRIMAAVVAHAGGNAAPQVDAGTNLTVSFPMVANLNGTVSDDGLPKPPGRTTSAWSKVSGPGAVTFSNVAAVDTTASFSTAGTYVLRLTASDGLLSVSDTVTVSVNGSSTGAVTITREAESGNITAPMVVKSDPAASGGKFVEVPEGGGNNYNDATRGGPGQTSFSISIPQSRTYALWARTMAPSGVSDSFYVMRNGALWLEWNVPLSTTWKWNKIANVALAAGTLSLAFRQREDGTRLDQLLLTSDTGVVPSGNAPGLAGTVFEEPLNVEPSSLARAGKDTTPSLKPIGDGFTVILLSGTQNSSGRMSHALAEQARWVIANQRTRKIAYVAHLGGIVENADLARDWDQAESALSLFEDADTTGLMHGIPYGIVVGSREQSPAGSTNSDSTQMYNTYFGASRFLGRDYYGDQFGADNDNHYSLFSAAGLDFIVLYLEYDPEPGPAVLAWADSLLKSYSERRAILVGHRLIEPGAEKSFRPQGRAIYEALKSNANLVLMVSGGPGGAAWRSDVYYGNTVYTLLSGSEENKLREFDSLRLLEFSPARNEIRIRTYSPAMDQFKTDDDNQFTLFYRMDAVGPD
jgi:CubicO group peptidase (beta-lactamase class C family)